jgi:hypothetical protein
MTKRKIDLRLFYIDGMSGPVFCLGYQSIHTETFAFLIGAIKKRLMLTTAHPTASHAI